MEDQVQTPEEEVAAVQSEGRGDSLSDAVDELWQDGTAEECAVEQEEQSEEASSEEEDTEAEDEPASGEDEVAPAEPQGEPEGVAFYTLEEIQPMQPFADQERQVFDVLWRYREKAGLTCRRLTDILAIYVEEPDGGFCENWIRTIISRIKAQLDPIGVHIVNHLTGRRGYELEVSKPPEVAILVGYELEVREPPEVAILVGKQIRPR